MLSDMSDDDSDVELYTDPPANIQPSRNSNNHVLLPAKSKQRYETMYQLFEKWQSSNQTNLFSEEVLLVFFRELSATKSPSTLWSSFSMLKSMIKQQQSIDIGRYTNLLTFLKDQSKGYITVKAKVFTDDEIAKFINEAPDVIYLATKVVLIFGLMGACRTYELVNMSVNHIETHGRLFLVKIPKTETSTARSFTISDHYFDLVKKYQQLRPYYVETNRFFLNYQKGKCTAQVIGKHKFAKMPRQIAEYLQLEDPNGYTGHSFRRTSTKLLSNISAEVVMNKHGAWKSTTRAEDCVESDPLSEDKADALAKIHKNERSINNNRSSSLKVNRNHDATEVEIKSNNFFCDGQDTSAINYVDNEFQGGHVGEMKIEASSIGSHESYLEEPEEFPPSNSFEQAEITMRASDLESNMALTGRNYVDSIRDEYQIFGRSVAVELQKLPARDAILAKSEIQAILTRYRLKNTPP